MNKYEEGRYIIPMNNFYDTSDKVRKYMPRFCEIPKI